MPCFPRNFFEGKEKEKKEERRKKPRFQNHCNSSLWTNSSSLEIYIQLQFSKL